MSGARFRPGARVHVCSEDPDHHTRVPRYLRGHVGQVVALGGEWPLPDDVARGRPAPRVETVYAVRFAARDLWGTGDHTVTADLWECYLEQAPEPEEAR
jgi:nitrile hydratase subunit beta